MIENTIPDGYQWIDKDREHRPDLSSAYDEYDGKFERAERKMELEELLNLKRKELLELELKKICIEASSDKVKTFVKYANITIDVDSGPAQIIKLTLCAVRYLK